jgi:hypothetical protein
MKNYQREKIPLPCPFKLYIRLICRRYRVKCSVLARVGNRAAIVGSAPLAASGQLPLKALQVAINIDDNHENFMLLKGTVA